MVSRKKLKVLILIWLTIFVMCICCFVLVLNLFKLVLLTYIRSSTGHIFLVIVNIFQMILAYEIFIFVSGSDGLLFCLMRPKLVQFGSCFPALTDIKAFLLFQTGTHRTWSLIWILHSCPWSKIQIRDAENNGKNQLRLEMVGVLLKCLDMETLAVLLYQLLKKLAPFSIPC